MKLYPYDNTSFFEDANVINALEGNVLQLLSRVPTVTSYRYNNFSIPNCLDILLVVEHLNVFEVDQL
ncbi:MAG: hypothetical protein IJ599_01835 [Alphaproteobacteria bacterium]|nr:hypothetical protein [Alphaproteobacteria bacterium]